MDAVIFIEGGGDSKDLHLECRKAFRMLLEKTGFSGRMPRLVVCGGRDDAYDDFRTSHEKSSPGEYIAILVESEDPLGDINRTWEHLKKRDGWKRPESAEDEQVLFMTTCMETWIVSDRQTLRSFFGACLQETALPSLHNMENTNRHAVQKALTHATRTCKKRYKKGKVSFEIMQKINPDSLKVDDLPSFLRMVEILRERL